MIAPYLAENGVEHEDGDEEDDQHDKKDGQVADPARVQGRQRHQHWVGYLTTKVT